MVSPSPPFPSKLKFGSFLVYPSPAKTDAEKAAKDFILLLKRAGMTASGPIVDIAADRLVSSLSGSPLANLLDGSETLVPMPGSAPLLKKSVWSAANICDALVARSLGLEVRPYLRRAKPIRKSAYCAINNQPRPSPREHYESMAVLPLQGKVKSVILVDDVITRGSTLLGAAARLIEVFPGLKIRAFAMAHTESGMTQFASPCDGWVICAPEGSGASRQNNPATHLGLLF